MPDFTYVFHLLKRRRRLKQDAVRLRRELSAIERQLVELRGDQLLARSRRRRHEQRRDALDRHLEQAIGDGACSQAVELATRATHLMARAARQWATETQRRTQLVDRLDTRTRLKRELAEAEAEQVDVNQALVDLLWGPSLPEPQSP